MPACRVRNQGFQKDDELLAMVLSSLMGTNQAGRTVWKNKMEGGLLRRSRRFREAIASTFQAVAELPEHYRALLVLRDVEELSNDEVADVLGESVSSVKSRLHRARMALREVLKRRLGREHWA